MASAAPGAQLSKCPLLQLGLQRLCFGVVQLHAPGLALASEPGCLLAWPEGIGGPCTEQRGTQPGRTGCRMSCHALLALLGSGRAMGLRIAMEMSSLETKGLRMSEPGKGKGVVISGFEGSVLSGLVDRHW